MTEMAERYTNEHDILIVGMIIHWKVKTCYSLKHTKVRILAAQIRSVLVPLLLPQRSQTTAQLDFDCIESMSSEEGLPGFRSIPYEALPVRRYSSRSRFLLSDQITILVVSHRRYRRSIHPTESRLHKTRQKTRHHFLL